MDGQVAVAPSDGLTSRDGGSVGSRHMNYGESGPLSHGGALTGSIVWPV